MSGSCSSCDRKQLNGRDLVAALGAQSKLTVTPPNDSYEREADAISAQVTGPDLHPNVSPTPAISRYVQRQSEDRDEAEEDALQTARHRVGRSVQVDDIERDLARRRGRGAPLPGPVRARMEERFGFDFGSVRIHADAGADRLSRKLDSLAFTHGPDVFFSQGRYAPESEGGERLLAHELTHVVQQSGGSRGGEPIQRSSMETKGYYRRYEPFPRTGILPSSSLITGVGVHEKMQGRLREVNPDLITEAPIPGAKANAHFSEESQNLQYFKTIGRADLYMSTNKGAISGVVGDLPGGTEFELEHTDFQYKDRANGGISKRGKGKVKRSPRRPDAQKPFKGNFPSDFYVSDLKPLGTSKISEGFAQIANYLDGFENFAARAHKDGVTASGDSGDIEGHPLQTGSGDMQVKIPEGLDYANIDNVQERTRKDGEHGAVILGRKGSQVRYWLAPLETRGVLTYFHLAHPFPGDIKHEIDDTVEQFEADRGMTREQTLERLQKRIRETRPRHA